MALKKWLFGINPGIAPFHIDIHGKYDSEDDFCIDLGTVSMEKEYAEEFKPLDKLNLLSNLDQIKHSNFIKFLWEHR